MSVRIDLTVRCVFLLCLFSGVVMSQNLANSFKYQGVARDGNANVLEEQEIGIEISILHGSMTGTLVYTETHITTTNHRGMFGINVGEGGPVNGTFSAIDWANGPYFINVGMDENGGFDYVTQSTSQLLSVPYALYALKGGTPGASGPTGADGIDGADGAAGPVGLQGSTGPTGPVGAEGIAGLPGPVGTEGIPGVAGMTGPTGAAGISISIIGPTGPTGPDGLNGPTLNANTNETIRHDGSGWIANGLLVNNGVKVGVGVDNPAPTADDGSMHIKSNLLLGEGNAENSYLVGDRNLVVGAEATLNIVADANNIAGPSMNDIVLGSGSSSSTFGTTQSNYGNLPRLEFMRFKSTFDGARVGINNSNPSSTLSVTGNVDISGQVSIGTLPSIAGAAISVVDSDPIITFGDNEDPISHAHLFLENGSYGFKSSDGFIPLNIDIGTGNVGLSTNNPTEKLDVNGGIRTSYSGTHVFWLGEDGLFGSTPYYIPVPEMPASMVGVDKSLVIVTCADGEAFSVYRASVTSTNEINVLLSNHSLFSEGNTRLNYIIFPL